MNQCYLHEAIKLNNVQLTLKIMDTCVPEAIFFSRPNSFQRPGHFLFRVFNSRHDVHSAGWRRYVTGIPSLPIYFLILNYHISVSIRKSAKRGHCTRAEQEWCIMTD